MPDNQRTIDMQTLALGLFNGISYGMLLFLMAAGLTLVLSMLGCLISRIPRFTCSVRTSATRSRSCSDSATGADSSRLRCVVRLSAVSSSDIYCDGSFSLAFWGRCY